MQDSRSDHHGFKRGPTPYLCVVWHLFHVALCSICVALSSAHFLPDASITVFITCVPSNRCTTITISIISAPEDILIMPISGERGILEMAPMD